MSKIAEIAAAVEGGKVKLIEALVQEAIESGEDPSAILDDGMVSAMGIVGQKFQQNELFVPEMLVSAKTMKKGIEILKPHLTKDSLGKKGKVIIGTVAGDLHDIGKNLVALMLESAGFEVIDLGVDVSPKKFLDTLAENPDTKIVAASTLLTTTMRSLKDIVEAVEASEFKDKVFTMVGGAPVTQDYADEIGATAYTPDAGSAASKAIELVS
ncbi:MAG: corrinoid protein [Oscillospiraceae bacterium]|nr:corrinoid protein [Oscillospiraceae bacterium]